MKQSIWRRDSPARNGVASKCARSRKRREHSNIRLKLPDRQVTGVQSQPFVELLALRGVGPRTAGRFQFAHRLRLHSRYWPDLRPRPAQLGSYATWRGLLERWPGGKFSRRRRGGMLGKAKAGCPSKAFRAGALIILSAQVIMQSATIRTLC